MFRYVCSSCVSCSSDSFRCYFSLRIVLLGVLHVVVVLNVRGCFLFRNVVLVIVLFALRVVGVRLVRLGLNVFLFIVGFCSWCVSS